MSAMQSEVYQAFRAIDVPEDKALKAAAALADAFSRRDAETETYIVDRDGKIERIEADIASIKIDLAILRDGAATKADMSAITADLASLRASAATKADLASLRDGAATKADLNLVKIDITAVKGDVAVLKWMVGFLLAFNVAIIFKLFSH